MENQKEVRKCKFERTTQEQLQFFVQFCKEHPELQAGKNSPQAPQAIQNLWEEVANNLNAMRGATRTAAKWKESLSHWKNQLRSRARKAKAEGKANGGGPRTLEIADFEEQALHTFGAAAVDGFAGVASLGFQESISLSDFIIEALEPVQPPISPPSAVQAPISSPSVVQAPISPPSASLLNDNESTAPKRKKIDLESIFDLAMRAISKFFLDAYI